MKTKAEILDLMKVDVRERIEAIADFVRDTNNSREDRLEVFLAAPPELYNADSWVWSPPQYEAKFGHMDWYDQFYVERHAVVNVQDMVANCLRDPAENPFLSYEDRDNEAKKAVAAEKFKLFLDDALNECIHEFTFDW